MTAFWTDFVIRLNVAYKTPPVPGIQANKNLSPTPSTSMSILQELCIEKQRDLITQSEHEPHCFRKSSRLYMTWPLEEDQVLQYVGSDLSTSGSQGFLDALVLGTLWLWCQPALHQDFGMGWVAGLKRCPSELTATSRFEMSKADVDSKSFLPNSPTQKCVGVMCM